MARVNKPIRNKFEYRSTVFVAAGGDQRAIDRITNEFGKEGWESYAIDFINCIIYFKREITD